MNEIPIVRRRSRMLPIVLTFLVIAILVLAGLWLLGMLPDAATQIDVRNVIAPALGRAGAVLSPG